MQRILRKIITSVLIGILLSGQVTHAVIPWVDGGLLGAKQIGGTFEYQEVTFVTGEPVILKGLVALPVVPTDKDAYTLKYAFTLVNLEKNIELQRSATFSVVKEIITVGNSAQTQTRFKRTLTAYTETITTAGGEYTLAEYTFDDSRLYDNTPSVDYFSGSMIASRKYYKNGDFLTNEGYLTLNVDMRPIVGYKHKWGESETQVATYLLKSYIVNPDYKPEIFGSAPYKVQWEGSVDVGMATTQKVTFDYLYTDPQNISFRGNFIKVVNEENVLTYSYVLPKTNNGAIDLTSKERSTGKVTLSKEVVLSSEALIAPRIRDIAGHWAEGPIQLLTSLQIFDVEKEYFVPKAEISRLEFGKAMVHAIYGVLPTPSRTDILKRQRPNVEKPFLDVTFDDPNYHYLEFIKSKEIMAGKNHYFKGGELLTRAEAIQIIIAALGLQYIAPNPPYRTTFVDDANIPEWSKDAIYMANEIGIVTGTPEGYINARKRVTKEEAAVMIDKFMAHLREEINYDYREKILNR